MADGLVAGFKRRSRKCTLVSVGDSDGSKGLFLLSLRLQHLVCFLRVSRCAREEENVALSFPYEQGPGLVELSVVMLAFGILESISRLILLLVILIPVPFHPFPVATWSGAGLRNSMASLVACPNPSADLIQSN